MNQDKIRQSLSQHSDELRELGKSTMATFGSVIRNEQHSSSDIDIPVDFDSKKRLIMFVELKGHLEEIPNCKVDLIRRRRIHPTLKDNITNRSAGVF